ncbi:unnamed protein product, partial [Pylaiella littoralis]
MLFVFVGLPAVAAGGCGIMRLGLEFLFVRLVDSRNSVVILPSSGLAFYFFVLFCSRLVRFNQRG